MKQLLNGDVTAGQLIAALDGVGDLPVKVWWGEAVRSLTINDIEYGKADKNDEEAVWINVFRDES